MTNYVKSDNGAVFIIMHKMVNISKLKKRAKTASKSYFCKGGKLT